MHRSVSLLAAAFLALAAARAEAAATAETGAELAAQCQVVRSGAADSAPGIKCLAYLIGLFDALRTFSANARDPLICPPQGIDDRTFAEAYLRWAQYNPHRLGLYPVAGAVEAIVQAFPCAR